MYKRYILQDCTQIEGTLERDVYVKALQEIDIDPDMGLKAIKPLSADN